MARWLALLADAVSLLPLGCTAESINPVLVGPDSSEYACSSLATQSAGTQVTSTCGIPFSAMRSGVWKIIVSGDQIAVQRSITLTVGIPQTVVVTVSYALVASAAMTDRMRACMCILTNGWSV
jgi:hypothetical protein